MVHWLFIENFEKTMALLGGFTGLVSAIVSWLALARDRADIKFNVYLGTTLANNGNGYKQTKEQYFCASITNQGRRGIVLTSLSGASRSKWLNKLFMAIPILRNHVLQLAFLDNQLHNLVQAPGRVGRFYSEGETYVENILLADHEEKSQFAKIDWQNVGCLYVTDSAGKNYYVSPTKFRKFKENFKKVGLSK